MEDEKTNKLKAKSWKVSALISLPVSAVITLKGMPEAGDPFYDMVAFLIYFFIFLVIFYFLAKYIFEKLSKINLSKRQILITSMTVLTFLLIGYMFYWFQIRPSQIKTNCSKTLPMNAAYKANFQKCLNDNGL